MPKTNHQQILKYFLLLLASVTLSCTLLGAIPMRVIRKSYSRRIYWSGLAIASVLSFVFLNPMVAIATAILTSLVGLYSDAEEAGSGFFAAGFFASLTTSSFALVSAAFWATRHKVDLVQLVHANIADGLAQMKAVNPQVDFSTDSMVAIVPSAFVIFLIVSLALALICDRPVGRLMGTWQGASRNLLSFKLPEPLIWITIAAVAGALGQQKYLLLQNVCVNLVYILALLYFFQGLAIAKHFFTINRVSKIWQAIAFAFMLLQLGLFVSLLGFSDYWVNYRVRFNKQRQSETPFKSEN